MSVPEKHLLKTSDEAKGFCQALLDRAREEAETRVAEEFKEARRLAPDGVDSDDMVIAVTRALREWRP